jgi:hypothetical protein
MSFFPMVETFFFISLGISFLLIFLMVYHFKNRVDSLEQSNVALADICKTMVYEMETIKRSVKEIRSDERIPSEAFPNASLMMEMFRRSQFEEEEESADPIYKKIVISDILNPGLDIREWTEVVNDDEEEEEEEDEEEEEEEKIELVVEQGLAEELTEGLAEGLAEELAEVEDLSKELTEVEDDLISELDQVDTISTISQNKPIKNSPYQKMNVQMLRTLAIQKALCADPSKMKKLDLIQLLTSA